MKTTYLITNHKQTMSEKENILYPFRSGKPIKFLSYVRSYAGLAVPDVIYRHRLPSLMRAARKREDFDIIMKRVNYYMSGNVPFKVAKEDSYARFKDYITYTGCIGDYHRRLFHTVYYFDQHDVTRWFPAHFRWNFCPGDVYFTPDTPTVVKSRLLNADNGNAVLLKLNKLRHFMFVSDSTSFTQKRDMAIFRGKIRNSRLRTAFLNAHFDNPRCDCGVVGNTDDCPREWIKRKKTIREHLEYKFIMAIEGNDVASNLKWVMSSNSLAVMTRPTCETWFMEGQLKPGIHYVEVSEDFSDLDEKMDYYIANPAEAETIIHNAHEYVRQFRDKKRERIISLLVMDKYFRLSGQNT